MKHDEIVRQLVVDAQSDLNILGFLVFGSVARGTQREDSDIDAATILRVSKPPWGINSTSVDGIKVENIFLTYDVFSQDVNIVPYLMQPLAQAKILLDREGTIKPLREKIQLYLSNHPDIVKEWEEYYQQSREEKAQFGCEKKTFIDVLNEFEKKYSDGKVKRRFFSSFILTHPRIFALLKKFL